MHVAAQVTLTHKGRRDILHARYLTLMRFAVLILLVAIEARDASACGAAVRDDLVLDPAYADDTSPPSAPVVASQVHVSTGTDCGDFGLILLDVSSVDDRAPAEKLGFRLDVESSDAQVSTRPYAVVPAAGQIYAYFDPTVDALHARLSVRAVDLNGNIGDPTFIDIAYEAPRPPDEGCNAGGSDGLALALLVLARCTLRRNARPSA